MRFLVPQFEGELAFERLPDDFVARIERRLSAGWLVPGNRSRARYVVQDSGRDHIAFASEGFLTTYNIGFNDVRIRRSAPHTLHYQVTFWKWTRYAIIHGALLGGLLGGAWVLLPAMKAEVASKPGGVLALLVLDRLLRRRIPLAARGLPSWECRPGIPEHPSGNAHLKGRSGSDLRHGEAAGSAPAASS